MYASKSNLRNIGTAQIDNYYKFKVVYLVLRKRYHKNKKCTGLCFFPTDNFEYYYFTSPSAQR